MSRIFGTDGVRGIANTELTSELAYNFINILFKHSTLNDNL